MAQANRPVGRLSREMRLLIVTVLIAAGVLLLLARLRFPDAPAPLDISAQPLERLAARASFEELATRLARLDTTLAPNLIVLRLAPEGDTRPVRLADVSDGAGAERLARHVPALRIDTTTAVACVSPTARISGIVGEPAGPETAGITGVDPIRHVARIRVPEGRPVALRQLPLAGLQTPTYVAAVEGTRAGLTIRPVFLGRSDRFSSPRWIRPLMPLGGAVVTSGALIFTLEGEFLGCTILDEGSAAIASGTDVLDAVGRASAGPGRLVEAGIAVQPLTAETAAATGAAAGVVVAEVIQGGAASGVLEAGDVIVEIDGRPARDPKAVVLELAGRLAAGPVRIAYVRGRQVNHADLAAPARASGDRLRLDPVRGAGARVLEVDDGSPLAAAGVTAGDVILRVGEVRAPTPAQVTSALRTVPLDGLLIVVRRGTSQHVTAVRAEGHRAAAR